MCREFKITVEAIPNNKTVPIEPEFMLRLANQRVKVGDSLVYSPGVQLGTYGYLMDVRVDLGDAFRFAFYDKALNTFKVVGDKVLPEDVGDYNI